MIPNIKIFKLSITGELLYIDTAKATAEYVLREMTSKDGGFYSAQDADSEGVEGKFYTFALNEIMEVLGEKGARFAEVYDITSVGTGRRFCLAGCVACPAKPAFSGQSWHFG